MAKVNLLEIKDEKHWETLQKYLGIEKMIEKIREPRIHCPSYYLMNVKGIKYVFEVPKDIPKAPTYLLRIVMKLL